MQVMDLLSEITIMSVGIGPFPRWWVERHPTYRNRIVPRLAMTSPNLRRPLPTMLLPLLVRTLLKLKLGLISGTNALQNPTRFLCLALNPVTNHFFS